MATRGRCRYFGSQKGCRFGDRCKFSHDLHSTSEIRSPQHTPQQNVSPLTLVTPGTRSRRTGNSAQRNICNYYWNTGQCNRGFDCTFRHQKNTGPQSENTGAACGAEGKGDAANVALDFFTMDNLTQMAGVGLHSAQEGTPEHAHNSIKQYIGGGTLSSASDLKPLADILASVNRRNHSWVGMILSSAPINIDLAADDGQSSGNTLL